METGFLNFRDEEHFSGFSSPLGQHDILEESHSSLMELMEDDFHYNLDSRIDSSAILWGTEQELNGDMAVLPDSGVATVYPKMEHIKEDFAKMLTDWQEHIGSLQASDPEEDIDVKDMVGLDIGMPEKVSTDIPDNIFEDEPAFCSYPTPKKQKSGSPYKAKFEKSDFSESQRIAKLKPQSSICSGLKQPKTEMNDTVGGKDRTVKLKAPTDMKKIKLEKTEFTHSRETEMEDCIDVETVSEQVPVLEARDVKSLLEQFEASEAVTPRTSITSYSQGITSSEVPSAHHSKSVSGASKSLLTPNKKPAEAVDSTLHQNIMDSLPKEVIDRIKASGRKRVIPLIPAIPTRKSGTRSSGTRMQDAAATLSRNKLLKIVTCNSNGNGRADGSVQLDHDYCSSASPITSCSESNAEFDRQCSDSEKFLSKKDDSSKQSISQTVRAAKFETGSRITGRKTLPKSSDSWADHNSKKDSGLESGDVSDASEELPSAVKSSGTKISEIAIERSKEPHQDSLLKQTNITTTSTTSISTIVNNLCTSKTVTKPSPVHEMKIRSALATSILQLRKGVLTKTKPVLDIANGRRAGAYIVGMETGNPKVQQMVSVLKKPPTGPPTTLAITSNPNESIVTTTNSSNGEVQNIIVQDFEQANEDVQKPVRKKLNLAEYRSRRDKNRSDNSRTNSPIQPMTLIYIHHVSTTTEPIKDDPENPVWSEREIVSVLKPKADVEEEKNRPKVITHDVGIQTNETVFNSPAKNNTLNNEKRTDQIRDRKNRRYRRRRDSSSLSRSRSRSSSKSRSTSTSHRRSTTRRRRISHRRSSVSSSSSWSSRSRSRSRSTSRSLSRSRSRSRSSRSSRSRSRSRSRSSSTSRSRSRSSSRYSSCSRSPTPPNSGKGKTLGHRRRLRRDHAPSYDRPRRHSSDSSHSYQSWRRSSSSLGRKPYDTWTDREKQRQVEERRVIYVGRLEEGVMKADLRRRFEAFGPVVDISVHFREHGDNYGFVTFAYKNDAYEAVEHGNDDPSQPRYDLCFGGRRAFCKVKYADLDGMASNSLGGGRGGSKLESDNSFDLLLKEAQAKLRKRKV
ncbi:serine/arginine repetitive matrix protein 2 isoform X2 [Athalia rosae]|uniref:serine/arginine repetitive matrix protein 2 isoform X2 n=1 Tax=Athalia rosae TaxID=37344 RepID=UPI002033DB02|nr:serine/arginine repetitive matrix protein 2 isoform X2 [Athalia rosae]